MKFPITVKDRLRLRQAMLFAPQGDLRRRAVCLLHLADGRPVAAVGRSCGVSRPTLYKWARVFLATRRVADLRRRGIERRARESRGRDEPAVEQGS